MGAAVTHAASTQTVADVEETEGLAEVKTGTPEWQITTKERDHCASIKKDCMASKCCGITGYHCLLEKGKGKCSKNCPKTGPCTILSETMTFDVKPHKSMFCFSVYTKHTGSTKPSTELDLLKLAYKKKISLFACEAQAVYGDVEEDLGGFPVVAVEDTEKDWHFAKRKHMGTWINTGLYKSVWKAIGKAGVYASYDWTVKVDADCVFFPKPLVERIRLMPVPPTGAFLQNCEGVKYGFFGNLEVMSKVAFSILLANIDTCDKKTVANWKVGIDHGKYGPMGEDLFAEMCMRKNGVAMLDAFDITQDGMCAAKRPGNLKKSKKWKPDCAATETPAMHPFKKPAEYAACVEAYESA